MNDGHKQRLVGALVLTALAVIFLPSLFKREERSIIVDKTTLIPPPPKIEPVVVAEPVQPETITPAPPPDQAFQPTEISPPSPADTQADEKPVLDESGLPKAWTVQIASFAEPERAQTLRDKLLAEDYHVYLRVLKTEKGEVTRVFIGPQIERQRAQAIKSKIDKELSVNSLVMSFAP